MSNFDNGLDKAQTERLVLLMEECGEVIQACSKILRHGYKSEPPNGGRVNLEQLEKEISDVMWVVQLMLTNKDLRPAVIEKESRATSITKPLYLHHQGSK